jgi:hypothetical protein
MTFVECQAVPGAGLTFFAKPGLNSCPCCSSAMASARPLRTLLVFQRETREPVMKDCNIYTDLLR